MCDGSGYSAANVGERSESDGQFRLDVDLSSDNPVVVVSGDVDLHSAPELRERLASLVEGDALDVTVDLSDTTFVDSMGLGVLLAAKKQLATAGGELGLVVSSPEIRRVFEITMLDRVFTIHATRAAAVASACRAPG